MAGNLLTADAGIPVEWQLDFTQMLLGVVPKEVAEAINAAAVPHWFDYRASFLACWKSRTIRLNRYT